MHLLPQLVLVVLVATTLVALFHRLRLPSLLGFIVTGALLGPVGFGLVTDSEEITVMAELGVVLLMFTIGLEISIGDLARMARQVLGGGLLQIGATAALCAGALIWDGFDPRQAIAIGLVVSASSTALVLRLLGDRGELSSSYGQLSLAILLMQDFAVVGLMLLVPMLAATGDAGGGELATTVLRAIVFAVMIFVSARFAFPWLLSRIVQLRNREVFLLATLLAALGTAWVAELAGLSLALGSFIAGLVISESEYSHQMFAEVLPFRDVFNGLFFVSIGLLLEPDIIIGQWPLLLLAFASVVLAKGLIVMGVAKLFRLSWRNAFLAGVALAQIGEFGLILGQQARSLELIGVLEHGVIITVAVVTMALTPVTLIYARRLVRRFDTPSAFEDPAVAEVAAEMTDHVIVVGYGINGRNVSRALRMLAVPHVIVEMNPVTVQQGRARGLSIVFGDATRPALLHHLGVTRARALVAAVADAAATREIVANAHHANPTLEIIARTRYIAEIDPLHELGATDVVPEEFETSIELVARVMTTYGASQRAVEIERRRLREAHYGALLGADAANVHAMSDLLTALHVENVVVTGGSSAIGSTLRDLDLRAQTGATVLAVLRTGEELEVTPPPEFEFSEGDVVWLVGDARAFSEAARVFAPETDA